MTGMDPSGGAPLGRRAFLAALGAAAMGGCAPRPVDPRALRLGCFPNLTHGPALTLTRSGRLAAALPGVWVRPTLFNAGPAAMSALLAGEVDACFVGPVPAASAFLRSHGRALRVVSGVCSGGASLVLRPGTGALRGRRIGAPQLGGTQDIALRHYLRTQGLRETTMGGDVFVVNMESANLLALYRQGRLDGAWLPEPWASRMIAAGATLRVDERALWPGGDFSTTLLVVRRDYLRDAPRAVDGLVAATRDEVARFEGDREGSLASVAEALRALTGASLPATVLAAAWSRMRFTADPLRASVHATIRHGQELAMLPPGGAEGLFDARAGG